MTPEERLLDLRLQARRILFSLEDLSIEKQSINDAIVKLRERRAHIRKLEAEFEKKFVALRDEMAVLERGQKSSEWDKLIEDSKNEILSNMIMNSRADIYKL